MGTFAVDGNAVSEERYNAMKPKMADIKQLFHTRHYIQCVALCERLLIRDHKKIHAVHLAYIHFYLGLSHDTMAREATLRRRNLELNLAETHYLAAITSLCPSQSQSESKLETVMEDLPASPVSTFEHASKGGRRASNTSQQSLASSATSLGSDDYEPTPQDEENNFKVITVSPSKKRPHPIYTPDAAYSYQEELFSAEVSSFRGMIRNHIQNVRELKEATFVPLVRFSFAPPRDRNSTTIYSRPISRDSSSAGEEEMDGVKSARKGLSFRPRFDASSVQKLCSEALSELRK